MSANNAGDPEELSDTEIFDLYSGVSPVEVAGSPILQAEERGEEVGTGSRRTGDEGTGGNSNGGGSAHASRCSSSTRETTPNEDTSELTGMEEDLNIKGSQPVPRGTRPVPSSPASFMSPSSAIHMKRAKMSSDADNDSPGKEEKFVPPHLLVAGSLPVGGAGQVNNFGAFKPGSVVEGAGRTLRGRDAFKFRRAVMSCTGFLD